MVIVVQNPNLLIGMALTGIWFSFECLAFSSVISTTCNSIRKSFWNCFPDLSCA